MGRHRRVHAGGFTLVELLLAIALAIVLAGMALPLTASAIDELRTLPSSADPASFHQRKSTKMTRVGRRGHEDENG